MHTPPAPRYADGGEVQRLDLRGPCETEGTLTARPKPARITG